MDHRPSWPAAPGGRRGPAGRLHRDQGAQRHLPGRTRARPRCGPAGHRPCPAWRSPGRGPTPAGRRPWKARCAAAGPRRTPRSPAGAPAGAPLPPIPIPLRLWPSLVPCSQPTPRRWRDPDHRRSRRPGPLPPGRRPGAERRPSSGWPPRSAGWPPTTWAGPTPRATRSTSPGGKGIRPDPGHAVGRGGLGRRRRWACPAAVAVELVHNFSLIHDDIIDTDTERHHRPTVWSVFGIGPAIVAGDALQILAHQVLLETSLRARRGRLGGAGRRHRGHDRRPGRRHRLREPPRRHVEQCMAMSAAKTGALLGCAASIGAILAGAPGRHRRRPARLRPPSRPGLPGRRRPARDLGRPGPDRQAGRQRPAPAQEVHAGRVRPGRRRGRSRRAAGPDARAAADEPAQPIGAPRAARRRQIERATYLVEACGGREWTAVRAKANLDAALGALERVRLSAIPHRDLADIAVYVVERES